METITITYCGIDLEVTYEYIPGDNGTHDTAPVAPDVAVYNVGAVDSDYAEDVADFASADMAEIEELIINYIS